MVRPRNSAALAKAIREAGGEAEFVQLPGMSHAGIIMALSKPFRGDGEVLRYLVTFAQNQLAEPTSAAVQGASS